MATIIGDWTGTTYKDFLILPSKKTTDEHVPEKISIETDLAGIKLQKPFAQAAMRSLVGKDMAFAASKEGMLPVVPRGLTVASAVDIVRYVKDHEIKRGEIEVEEKPVFSLDDETLGQVLEKFHTRGHSTIPIQQRTGEFVGMFSYKSEYDRADKSIPITQIMKPLFKDGKPALDYCSHTISDEEIKSYMKDKERRWVPVLDEMYRLRKLVFLQTVDAYKVGAAIDTHEEWKARAKALVEAGADMIFIDTSAAFNEWAERVVKEYKDMFPDGPPICAGNIVMPGAFRMLADAGADVIKGHMGPASICITNEVLAVGGPPFWTDKMACDERDAYFRETGKYVPYIADGGIEDSWDINVAMTQADAVMCGKIFARFHESAGRLIPKGKELFKEYWGEGSKRAAETTGDLKRYTIGDHDSSLYQGVDSLVPYAGHLKPGTEVYTLALKTAMSHAGSKNLKEYRENAVLLRLSERAKEITGAHGLAQIVG